MSDSSVAVADASIINPVDIQTRTTVFKLLSIPLTNKISLLLVNTSNVIWFESFIQIEHITGAQVTDSRIKNC